MIIHSSPRRYYSGGAGGPYPYRNRRISGCGTTLALLCIVLLFVAALWLFLPSNEVRKSTYAREALPASAVVETGYYTDEAGWFSDRKELESGMKAFYRETGVQPYLYLLPNGMTTSTTELTGFAETLYPQLFEDEGHFLLVFCDDGYGSYNCGYVVGSQAKTVMDDEAIAILADYLDRYYQDYSISEEEVFSNTFADTGKRIMTVTKSPVVPVAVCAAVVIVAVLAYSAFKKHQAQKKKEQEDLENILKTPLEKFGDQDIDDLAKKYEAQK